RLGLARGARRTERRLCGPTIGEAALVPRRLGQSCRATRASTGLGRVRAHRGARALMAEITYLEAIREALFEEMARDANVFCMGEDIGAYGGAFKVTDGLIAKFGEERVIDSPISEIALVGALLAEFR